MLQTLYIENIAVIEKAAVEFSPGMNIMTGETGAGKSIVIDALGAVLGARVSRELVRTGADAASISAVFSSGGDEWCAENGIEKDEDGCLILMRRISSNGSTSCRVNGVPVTAAQLRTLGSELLEISGQNEGLKLLDEKNHLAFLDGFAGLDGERERYRELYEEFTQARRAAQELRMNEDEKEELIERLKYKINELENANITPGEYDEKTARRDLLKNSARLVDAVNKAHDALYGGYDTAGAGGLISEAERAASSVVRYSDKLGEIAGRLTELRRTADDISDELRDFRDSLSFWPGELEELESRVDLLKKLMRRYGGTEEELLDSLDKFRDELENVEDSGERLKKLEAIADEKEKAALQAARELSARRKAAAGDLERAIVSELKQLSMPGASFKVEFSPRGTLSPTGADDVCFIMSANAGEALGHISKIASGGELARIMLAIKSVFAAQDEVQTQVFDEIDTGVSGVAAQRVGEKLAALALKRQIICVTHLPQIAVMADSHFLIEKKERGGRTYTEVIPLSEEGREQEISRLTGGENITSVTLASAAEQLKAAADFKRARK